METLRKKKVLIMTDHPCALTGFGKHGKNILEYLYKTGKYDLVNLAVGTVNNNQIDLELTPWKTIGTIQPEKLQQIQSQNDPKTWDSIGRMAGYGAFAVDEIVCREKPDVLFAIQDSWGVDFIVDDPQTHLPKPWFDKITSIIWVTLDSLPLLDKQIQLAKKSKNFWSWANFATKNLHKRGLTHTKTVPGCMKTQNFFRLQNSKRANLRASFGISPDTFVAGFVFRNQLRKSVPNLLQGFKMFKQEHPKQKAKLLLHTHWNEGWGIPKLMEEFGIPTGDVITTYICANCGKYEVKSFSDHKANCKFCQARESQTTTGPGFGVSEKQLNEVYNLMDVYVHPFTSGGLEIPCYEAKLTELITLVTNYSCGEDLCVDGAGSLPLEWAEYREPDSMFIKSSTYPSSIAKQFKKVLAMSEDTKKEMGQTARQWVINNYSVEKIGKILEDTIDNAALVEDPSAFEKHKETPNPYYSMPVIEDDGKWVLHMYANILSKPQVDNNDEGYKHWMGRINKDLNREQIEQYFRQVAYKTLQEQQGGAKFDDFLNPKDKGRVIIVNPEKADSVFLTTTLFQSIKSKYPDYALYVSTHKEFKEIIEGNPFVDRWIEFSPILNNLLFLEGNAQHKGFFEVAYIINSEQSPNWTHNGIDKIDFNIN